MAETPRRVTQVAAEMLGKYLQAGRVGFGDILSDGRVVRVERDWQAEMVSLEGEARVLDAFGPDIIDVLRRGETVAVNDSETDARVGPEHLATWLGIGTRGLVVAPILRHDRFIGILYVHTALPRLWTTEQVRLVADVAARTWFAYEQHRSEAAMRHGEAQKRAMLDAALDAIITIDADGKVVEWNNAAEKMFGQIRTAMLGQDLSEYIIPLEHREAHRRGMQHYQATGHGSVLGKRLELEAIRADGTRFPIELAISPISVEGISQFTSHIRDLTEQKRSQKALRESEERLRDITDALPILISYVDKDQRFRFVNKPYEAWFERPVDEILGHLLRDIMAPEVYEARRPFVERALAGEQVRYDIDMPRSTGITNTEIVHVPHLGADGQVLGIYALVQDITARKRSERTIAESEYRFRQLAELSPAIIWSTDANGTTTYISRRWQEFAGADAGDPSGRPPAILVHPDDRKSVADAWTASMLEEKLLSTEARFRRLDGEYIWHSIRAEPLRDISAAIVGWLGATTDVHSSVENAEERRRDHDRIWTLSQELMLVRDKSGTILSVNPTAKRLLGWSADEMVGKSVFDFIHPDDSENTAIYVARQFETAQVISLQNRYRTRDGSYRLFDWRGITHEGLVHAVGRDITSEHQAAEELRHAEEALRQAQKMEAVGQLTGGIAHDFNNMLAGIIGSLDALQRRLGAGRYEDTTRFIEGAIVSSRRAASLTQRLLAFGRRQSLDIKPVEVGKLVLSLEDLLRRTLGEAIEVRMNLDTNVGSALADPSQLESAILNLAINARDAMPDGGVLDIVVANRAEGSGRPGLATCVEVSVADTGTGMTPDVIARAFEPFFTTKPLGQGTGLGLSMVYGFMGQIGGQVTIDSVPGRGTRIVMSLPIAPNAESSYSPMVPLLQAPLDPSDDTVLVVEDDPAVRMLIVSVLEDLKLKCIEAEDGNAGLKVLKSEARIDLMVSDVGLPGINGRQLAEIAWQLRPTLDILFVTGYAEGAAIRPTDLRPGVRLMTKPFDLPVLGNTVLEMLQSRRTS